MKQKRIWIPKNSLIWAEPVIHLYGSDSIEIEGCRGILRYRADELLLDMGKFRVLIQGKNVCVTDMTGQDLVIEGKIVSLSFEREPE